MTGQRARYGKYEIIAPIAAGGMGVVYRARHVHLGTEVALKVLQASFAMNERVRHRFSQEAYVQAQLKHPSVVDVLDFIVEDQTLAFVMELINGPSLQQVCDHEKRDPWTPKDALAVMDPIARAVGWAHGRGVIHRDLKPANILMDRSKDAAGIGLPKITDFGLAKVLASQAGLSIDGNMMGTLPYMAPEQFAGRTDIDARADVFALGMMWWRLLTGSIPLDPDNMLACAAFYSGQVHLPSLIQAAPGTPPALAEILGHALALQPQQRPPDADVFSGLVREAMEGRSPTMPPSPIGAPTAAPKPAPTVEARAVEESTAPVSPQPAPTPSEPDSERRSSPAHALAAGGILTVGGILAVLLGVLVWVGFTLLHDEEAPPRVEAPAVSQLDDKAYEVEEAPPSPSPSPPPPRTPPPPTTDELIVDFVQVYYGRFNNWDLQGWLDLMDFPLDRMFAREGVSRSKMYGIYSSLRSRKGVVRIDAGGPRISDRGSGRYVVWIDNYKVYFDGVYDRDASKPKRLDLKSSSSSEHGFLVTAIQDQ